MFRYHPFYTLSHSSGMFNWIKCILAQTASSFKQSQYGLEVTLHCLFPFILGAWAWEGNKSFHSNLNLKITEPQTYRTKWLSAQDEVWTPYLELHYLFLSLQHSDFKRNLDCSGFLLFSFFIIWNFCLKVPPETGIEYILVHSKRNKQWWKLKKIPPIFFCMWKEEYLF